jgi:hypothetical protein
MDRLVLQFQGIAPELGSNLDSLVTELHELSGPISDLTSQINAFLGESSEMMNSLSRLLEILRSDPWELLIRTSGEGVWQ